MRIAAVSDLHCTESSAGLMKDLLHGVDQEADLLIMAGDLTNYGRIQEMEVLLKEVSPLKIHKIAVAGNHDHESDRIEELVQMLTQAGVCYLDRSTCEFDGVGFIGSKGFCGGFGDLAVQPFGERMLKAFINTSVEESEVLERELATLHTVKKIGILHYSPIKATLYGEEPELYPFLGSSLLADAFDSRGVDLILHGHAHNGSPKGFTPGGIPVHNVCRFVLARIQQRQYSIYDI